MKGGMENQVACKKLFHDSSRNNLVQLYADWKLQMIPDSNLRV